MTDIERLQEIKNLLARGYGTCADCHLFLDEDQSRFLISSLEKAWEREKKLEKSLKESCDTIHSEFCSYQHHPVCIEARKELGDYEPAG